jgi:hypothetical protein
VVVGDGGLEGVNLALREGYKISGRVDFSGSAERPPPARLTQIPVIIEPADGRQRTNFQQPGRVGPDGTFTATGLLPGRYFVRVGGAPGGWVTQSVTLGGVDVSDNPLELERDISGVLVTFTDRISDLRGTVRGVKQEEPAAVLVFPSDTNAWKNFGINPRRMRMTRANLTGAFAFGNMPAGDYYIVAVPDEYSGEWTDPAYLDVLTRVAMRITIGDGERKVQEVEVQDVKPPGGGQPLPIAAARPVARDASASDPPLSDGDAEPQQVRDRPVADPVGKGSISGVVVEDGSNRPVRRARVSVRSPDLRNEIQAMTDDQGRFVVPRLPGGSYTIYSVKPAYLTGYYGGIRPGRGPGVPLPLKEGQNVTGVSVSMARGGVISGVVMDQFGQPFSGGRIRLMQVQRRDGERILVGSGGSGAMTTDDRGAYRVYGLMPGTYAVGVVPPTQSGSETRALSEAEMRAALADLARKDPAPAAGAGTDATRTIPPAPPGPAPVVPPSGRALGLATVFYPGTVIDTEAATIPVAAGQEVSGIDFTLMFVPTSRIEGAVQMPDGQPAARAQVQITSSSAGTSTNATVRIQPDGKFQAIGVAPGRYAVIARLTGAPTPLPNVPPALPTPSPGPSLWAHQEVSVSGEDVTGLTLTLAPTTTITGRVTFEKGSAAPPEGATVRVSVDVFGTSRPGASSRSVIADKSGAFTLGAVTPGLYRMSASVQTNTSTPPPPFTVRTAVLDGREVFEQSFEVVAGRDHQDVVVTLTDRVPELSGTITDANGAGVAGLQILLFPTDRNAWSTSSRRMRGPARTQSDGTYRISGVRPGEYYLAVVTELEPGDWGDPVFMEQVAAQSLKLVFADGEKKVQNLRTGG